MHPFFFQGAHAHVDDIAGNQNQVWLLCINHVNPAVEFFARIMVAYMQVADHNQFQGTNHRTAGGERQFLAIFVLIVHIAIDKDAYHKDGNAKSGVPVII